MSHETIGRSDEWYTPKYIFDALQTEFDLDCASPEQKTFVPCKNRIISSSLSHEWNGFVWLNPPFGGRNGLIPWIDKFIDHGDGIILTPDRTSAHWWQHLAMNTDAVLFIDGKVKFIKPDGTTGDQPSNGTCLFSIGKKGKTALNNANKNKLGILYINQ